MASTIAHGRGLEKGALPETNEWGGDCLFRIALCEDIPAERENLLCALSRYDRFARSKPIVTQYENAESLLDALEAGTCFDLLFLDIFMASLGGMQAAHMIRRMGCTIPIVFLTSSPDFALESYDVYAGGYLLKPLDPVKLYALLDRLVDKLVLSHRSISVHHENGVAVLPYEAIMYAESRGNRLLIQERRGNILCTRQKLDAFEKLLDDPRFLRCHQSYLVNMDYITLVGDDFTLVKDIVVPIRVRERREIKERYFAYLFEHTLGR